MKNDELMASSIGEIVAAVGRRRKFLVATHVNPDGDAVGSVLALAFMLRKMGKEADPYAQDPAPGNLLFLPGTELIRHGVDRPGRYDAAVLVDCGDLSRVGPGLAESISRAPYLINIDHHVSSEPFGDAYWVDTSISSTCEMLYHLGEALGTALDADIATLLYTGIVTDTGSFRFSNTDRRVFEVAAKLVAAGADPARIAREVYDSAPAQRLRLLSKVLSTVSFHSGERLAAAELTREMFSETGTNHSDSDGFINHLRSVKTVEMAILFREGKDGVIHVSMRSKGSVDVSAFARGYNGGGHRNAAAFRIAGEMPAIREQVTRNAMEYI